MEIISIVEYKVYMKRVMIIVHGKVQGVFFRVSTVKKALSLSVTGLVINQSDGSVKIIAEGEEEKLTELIEWCKSGPPMARVAGINCTWELYKNEFNTFETR